MTNRSMKWVQLAPLLLFALAVWVLRENQNEVWTQVVRAKDLWRQGDRQGAIGLYQSIYQRYPKSRYTPDVLWELATIHSFEPDGAERAAYCFGQLALEFPGHPLALQARFRQAEIYGQELDGLNRAGELWGLLLEEDLSLDFRNQVLFHLGSAHFKMSEFDQALHRLKLILTLSRDTELVQQTRLLVGTIDQIQNRYEDSVEVLEEVLRHPECSECRLQAQLGLIQSYEVLDNLPDAIRVAESISASEFSEERKHGLVERLRRQAGRSR
ncbi:MAG: tetratricopeptide repeat protein [Acidobacteriota bacterium]